MMTRHGKHRGTGQPRSAHRHDGDGRILEDAPDWACGVAWRITAPWHGKGNHRPLTSCCATPGAGPRPGNPRDELCGRHLSTPAGRSRQPQTNTRKCG